MLLAQYFKHSSFIGSDNTFYGATRSRFYIAWLTPLV